MLPFVTQMSLLHILHLTSQGRLKPGRMLLVDTQEKVFQKDEVVKSHLANLRPVGSWLQEVF